MKLRIAALLNMGKAETNKIFQNTVETEDGSKSFNYQTPYRTETRR